MAPTAGMSVATGLGGKGRAVRRGTSGEAVADAGDHRGGLEPG